MQACWHACRHRCSVLLDRHHTSQSKKRRRRNLLSVLVEEGTSLAHCLSGTVPSAEATVMDPRDADQQAAAADYSGSHALPPPSPATIAAPLRISVPGRVSAGAFGPLRAQALGVSSPLPFTPIATPPTPLAHLAPATPISVESSPEPPPYARLHARNVPPRDLHALPAGLQHSIGGGAHRFHGDDGSDDESANEDEDEDDNLLGVSHGSQPGTGPLASFVESLRRSLLHALPAPASAAFYRWCQSRRGYRRRLVTLLLLLLAVSLVIYICAVASTCASSGGCRAWPFGHHAPPPHVPFTIISLLRDMSEETLLKDKSQFVIQWNAMISWSLVVPASQILIYMDSESSCRRIMSAPELKGLTCLVVPCWSLEHRRPLLDCIFSVAHATATTEVIAYVNGDILLHPDTQTLVNQASAWFDDFLLVSRRTDTLVPQRVLDEFSTQPSAAQVHELLRLAVTDGALHSEFGIDLFAYPKRLFDDLNFPAYLAGVYRWDNWLLSEMILRPNVAVIDGTRKGLVVHQEMGKVGHQGRTGAAYNDAIVKARSGMKYRIGNIANADYVVRYHDPLDGEEEANADGQKEADAEPVSPPELVSESEALSSSTHSLHFSLVTNPRASIDVLFAQAADAGGWILVVPVSHWDLRRGHVANWLCWSDRVKLRSNLFLAADRASERELRRRGLRVLTYDEAPEISTVDVTSEIRTPPSSGPMTAGGSMTRAARESLAFRAFHRASLARVLRAGFHFLSARLDSVLLEDPLVYLAAGVRSTPYGFRSAAERRAFEARTEPDSIAREFDIASPGNLTYAHSRLMAVRSTQWGKYAWKQLGLCEESVESGAKSPSLDCFNTVLRTLKSKLTRAILPELSFSDATSFFVDQAPQLHGVMPVMIQDEAGRSSSWFQDTSTLTAQESSTWTTATAASIGAAAAADDTLARKTAQIRRWASWKLLAIDVDDGGEAGVDADGEAHGMRPIPGAPFALHACIDLDPKRLSTLPVSIEAWTASQEARKRAEENEATNAASSTQPSTSSPAAAGASTTPSTTTTPASTPFMPDFAFKIRVLTFDRPRSLARLLDSLTSLEFEPEDVLTLEVSIDYPSETADEETLEKWRLTRAICDAYVWRRGPYSVVRQQQNIGLTGQWTWGWNRPDSARNEVILFLEDDTSLVPLAWTWIKKVIRTYYLDPNNYDPNMFGFSLQSQHTVLGESKQFRYGTRSPHDMLPEDAYYYRYQLLGTWGTVFFPEHWRAFTSWLSDRSFQHRFGTSATGFQPCVPSLLSNSWWLANPKRVWSQWMVRFAFEKGWYSLYTNFRNLSSVVVNYREAGLNFKGTAKGPMNPPVESLPPEYMNLPPLASTPLLDFHFRDWRHQPEHLKYHAALAGVTLPLPGGEKAPSTLPPDAYSNECYIVKELKDVVAGKASRASTAAGGAAEAELARLEAKRALDRLNQAALPPHLAPPTTVATPSAEEVAREAAAKKAAADAAAAAAAAAAKKAAAAKARAEREAAERAELEKREAAEAAEQRELEALERLAQEATERAKQQAAKHRASIAARDETRKKLAAGGDDAATKPKPPVTGTAAAAPAKDDEAAKKKKAADDKAKKDKSAAAAAATDPAAKKTGPSATAAAAPAAAAPKDKKPPTPTTA